MTLKGSQPSLFCVLGMPSQWSRHCSWCVPSTSGRCIEINTQRSLITGSFQVQGILTGGLETPCINKGTIKDAQAELYRAWTPLLRSWVQAVISTDGESPQAQ